MRSKQSSVLNIYEFRRLQISKFLFIFKCSCLLNQRLGNCCQLQLRLTSTCGFTDARMEDPTGGPKHSGSQRRAVCIPEGRTSHRIAFESLRVPSVATVSPVHPEAEKPLPKDRELSVRMPNHRRRQTSPAPTDSHLAAPLLLLRF